MIQCFLSPGEVVEWFKAAVLKTAEVVRSPWVRIPPSPPFYLNGMDLVIRAKMLGSKTHLDALNEKRIPLPVLHSCSQSCILLKRVCGFFNLMSFIGLCMRVYNIAVYRTLKGVEVFNR